MRLSQLRVSRPTRSRRTSPFFSPFSHERCAFGVKRTSRQFCPILAPPPAWSRCAQPAGYFGVSRSRQQRLPRRGRQALTHKSRLLRSSLEPTFYFITRWYRTLRPKESVKAAQLRQSCHLYPSVTIGLLPLHTPSRTAASKTPSDSVGESRPRGPRARACCSSCSIWPGVIN